MNKVTWMHDDGTVEQEFDSGTGDTAIVKGDTKTWDETVTRTAQAIRVETLPEPEAVVEDADEPAEEVVPEDAEVVPPVE